MTKEEILGLSFYPYDCGGMIDCVTKQDALKAMDVWAEQVASERAVEFVDWLTKSGYATWDEGKTWFIISNDNVLSGKGTSELYKIFNEQRSKQQ